MKKRIISIVIGIILLFSSIGYAAIVNFSNDSDGVVHLDYISPECSASIPTDVDKNYTYHSSVQFTCNPGPYSGASIQLAQYSGPYAFEAKCYVSLSTDNITIDPSNKYCTVTNLPNNTYDIHLTWSDVEIDYDKVKENSIDIIKGFNSMKDTGLIPNVILMNQELLYMDLINPNIKTWKYQYGYDSTRAPLWMGAYILQNPNESINDILNSLLISTKKVSRTTSKGGMTLPSNGIWAYTIPSKSVEGEVVAKSIYSNNPALDGPIAIAEYAISGNSEYYQKLMITLSSYDLSKNTPITAAKKKDFINSTKPYFDGVMLLLTQALLTGNGDLEATRQMINKIDFMKNYNIWINPINGFITSKTGKTKNALRVVFSVATAPHDKIKDTWIGAGKFSTVSEGMAYGLLITFAANDQKTFNKLLRYIIYESRKFGCAGLNEDQSQCTIKTNYLMPWLVDQNGRPFHYKTAGGFLSNGSASDADMNIVWALTLASKAWKSNEFNYFNLAKKMENEIARYDINKGVQFFGEELGEVYSPGSQWGSNGKNVFYPGYFAPQTFDALQTVR